MSSESVDQLMALIIIGLMLLFVFFAGETFLRRRKQMEDYVTPVTEEGLIQFDDYAPGEAVMLAWLEAGDHPRWHRQMQEEVRKKMPVLARALDRMVEN